MKYVATGLLMFTVLFIFLLVLGADWQSAVLGGILWPIAILGTIGVIYGLIWAIGSFLMLISQFRKAWSLVILAGAGAATLYFFFGLAWFPMLIGACMGYLVWTFVAREI